VCEKSFKASILSIGTELTAGIVQDLHGKTLSSALTALGIRVRKILSLPDDQPLIENELTQAVSESGIVLITGGLGPTSDDRTREAVAAVAGRDLEFREDCWQAILDMFPGRTIPDTNRKQACIPEGFTPLPNNRGTAAGFWGEISGCIVAALPGPPGELNGMFAGEVLPRLRRLCGLEQESLLWGTSFLIPESTLEDVLQECGGDSVAWGTRTEYLRIVFNLQNLFSPDSGGTEAGKQGVEAEKVKNHVFQRLQQKMGAVRIRRGIVDHPQLLVDALKEAHETNAGAESCTGGLIAKLITDIAGSSEVFWGSFISYANEAKIEMGVPEKLIQEHGAVSREVVAAMAEAALQHSGADIGFAVSGIAGPDGGTEEKPVGTVWLAVQRRDEPAVIRRYLYHGRRDYIRRKAAGTVLLLAEAVIKKREILDSDWNWEYI